jgi:hypothetical protein
LSKDRHQRRDGVAAADCESFLHLVFERVGGGGRVRAGGFRLGITSVFSGQLEELDDASFIRMQSFLVQQELRSFGPMPAL